jgi:Bcr/CflA subfamily drug resistance transporter
MLGYFASDMYLPAFPSIANSFNVNKAAVELSLSVYMFGLAIGQLFYGVISDRVGRKITLSAGLVIYLIGTIGCFFSFSIYGFLGFRIIQALGACSTTVLWQAIVIDKYPEKDTHKIFAIIFPLLGVSPALAPVIGGFLTHYFDWRSIFLTLTLIGVVLLLITLFLFRETTSAVSRAKNKKSLLTIYDNYKTLSTSRYYLGYIGVVCLATSAYFCYLTESPFVLKNLGFSAYIIGFFYIPQTIAFMIGGFISKWLVDKFGTHKTLQGSIYLALISSLIMLIATIYPIVSSMQIVIPFFMIAFCNGIIYPTGISRALSRFNMIAGTAAGLSGFLQAMTAFIATSIVASISYLGAFGMSLIIFILSILVILCYQLVKGEDPLITVAPKTS